MQEAFFEIFHHDKSGLINLILGSYRTLNCLPTFQIRCV